MNRRELMLVLGGAMTAALPLRAQQPKIPRVGILTAADSERAPMFDAFREGLRDLGYIEGHDIILEFRLAGGNLSLGPQLLAELATLPVDVIVTEGFASDAVAASGHIPIVAPFLMDPVQRGYASSLARPGGSITGFTLMHTELNATGAAAHSLSANHGG